MPTIKQSKGNGQPLPPPKLTLKKKKSSLVSVYYETNVLYRFLAVQFCSECFKTVDMTKEITPALKSYFYKTIT